MCEDKTKLSHYDVAIMNVVNRKPLETYNAFMNEISRLRSMVKGEAGNPCEDLISIIKEISLETEIIISEEPVYKMTDEVM
jgi:hypothetical protein